MTHAEMVERAARWLRGTMGCGVVLTERESMGERPDAIGWGKDVIVVECKLSRADFFADAAKPHRLLGMGALRYFMTLPALVSYRELPEGWGLLYAHPRVVTRVFTPLARAERNIDAEIRLVLSELRRYQLHGITYPAFDGSMEGRVPGLAPECDTLPPRVPPPAPR